MNDKISIIIPSRNRFELLNDRAIASILKQTYTNWELIIVDDGSEKPYTPFVDNRIFIYRIEKTYPYPRSSLKSEWMAGPCLALNEALKHISGGYIYRCDDDDQPVETCLEDLLCFAKNGDYDIVSADYKRITNKNYQARIKAKMQKYGIGGVQTWLIKEWLKKYEYNPDCWMGKTNEYDLLDRIINENPNIKIGTLDKVVCEIRPRPGLTMIGMRGYAQEQRGKLSKKDYNKAKNLSRAGLTIIEYEEKLKKQNCVCAICKNPETFENQYGIRGLCVDHNHQTGQIRGLLCDFCNRYVGIVETYPDVFDSIKEYIKSYKENKNV